MSYELVKHIKIENGKVFINSHSNNDTSPFHYWECSPLSDILKNEGENALNVAILKDYLDGTFQTSSLNKWNKALLILNYVLNEEMKPYIYNWNLKHAEIEKIRLLRESKEFNDLLLRALNTKLPKERYLIKKKYLENKDLYALKQTSRHLSYTDDISQAKEYLFKQQAEQTLKSFNVMNGEVILK